MNRVVQARLRDIMPDDPIFLGGGDRPNAR
jgi:hypothetical protein